MTTKNNKYLRMKTKLSIFLMLICFTSIFSQEITGSWKGELNFQGSKLPLVFNIKKNKESYTSTADSPLQQAKDIPVDKTVFEKNKLTLEISAIGGTYTGMLEGKKITGTFSQNGISLPLILESLGEKGNSPAKNETLQLPQNLNESIKRIDDFISYLEKNNAEAGEVSLFKNGKEIYKRNFGQQNLPSSPGKHSAFQIGSVTKTITASMIFKLIEKKQLNLNDKLSKFFPEVSNAEKITISQMLNHTSGLGDYVQGKDDMMWLINKSDDTKIMARIKEQGSVFEPGTDKRYSNTGYYLLTKILEKITKKSYAENLKETFTAPLQLNNLYTAGQNPANVYLPYDFTGKWKSKEDFDFNNVVGVGDIATDPTTLNIIINHIFEGKIVSKSSLSEMMPKGDDNFGKGIITVPFYSKKYYGHSGGTYGTNSLMAYNPEDKISFSYSLNADRIGANNFAIGVLSLLYNKEYEYPKLNNEKIPVSDLQKYAGEYSSKDIPLGLKIFIEDDSLFAQGTDQPAFPLEYVEKDQFKFDNVGVKIIFKPEKKQLTLIQNGNSFIFDKK